MKRISIFAIFLVASACTQEPLNVQTASGQPEAVFAFSTLQKVNNQLLGLCADWGYIPVSVQQNTIRCSRQTKSGEAINAQMALGGSNVSTPERLLQFTLIENGNSVRVIGQQWYQAQTITGQQRKVIINSNRIKNHLQQTLYNLGAK